MHILLKSVTNKISDNPCIQRAARFDLPKRDRLSQGGKQCPMVEVLLSLE